MDRRERVTRRTESLPAPESRKAVKGTVLIQVWPTGGILPMLRTDAGTWASLEGPFGVRMQTLPNLSPSGQVTIEGPVAADLPVVGRYRVEWRGGKWYAPALQGSPPAFTHVEIARDPEDGAWRLWVHKARDSAAGVHETSREIEAGEPSDQPKDRTAEGNGSGRPSAKRIRTGRRRSASDQTTRHPVFLFAGGLLAVASLLLTVPSVRTARLLWNQLSAIEAQGSRSMLGVMVERGGGGTPGLVHTATTLLLLILSVAVCIGLAAFVLSRPALGPLAGSGRTSVGDTLRGLVRNRAFLAIVVAVPVSWWVTRSPFWTLGFSLASGFVFLARFDIGRWGLAAWMTGFLATAFAVQNSHLVAASLAVVAILCLFVWAVRKVRPSRRAGWTLGGIAGLLATFLVVSHTNIVVALFAGLVCAYLLVGAIWLAGWGIRADLDDSAPLA